MNTKPRWAIIANALSVGSTSAHDICRAHGLDPDYELAAFGEQPAAGDEHSEQDAIQCDVCGDCICICALYNGVHIPMYLNSSCPLHGDDSEHCD